MTVVNEKENRKGVIYGVLVAVLGIILAAGTEFVFHGCGVHDDGNYGRCHYAQHVIVAFGILVAISALVSVFIKTKEALVAVSIITSVEAVIAILVPGIIVPLCMMETMRCNTLMRPFATIVSAIILIVSVGNLALIKFRKD